MKSPVHSNSLAILAARIQKEHSACACAVRRGVTHAMRAGELLLKAKTQIKEQYGHGHWLPWLKKHCAIPERTANLYMRLAKSKSEIGNVADLTVRKAITLLTESAALDGNANDGKHYWLTPPDLMANLNAEFAFDFDPCPHPRPDGFDGLTCEWGKSNYVNPPFTDGITAWVSKAIAEHAKGKRVVIVFPLDRWVTLMLEAGAKTRNLGNVKWLSIEDGTAIAVSSRPTMAFILE
jgi:hypothetical protein